MTQLHNLKQHKAPLITIVILTMAFVLLFSGAAMAAYTRNLSIGTYGTDVSQLQKSLDTLGYSLSVDGVFGPRTNSAVIDFQFRHGLAPDGIVGPLTRAAISKALALTQAPTTTSPAPTPAPVNNNSQPPSATGTSRGNTAPTQAPSFRKMILGYTEDADPASYSSVANYSGYMNSIATFTYQITSWGGLNLTTPDLTTHNKTVQAAKNNGIKVYALVHNMSGGSFSPDLAQSVLANSTNRHNLVNNLLNAVRNNGYAGVNIDIEGIKSSDRTNYVTFLSELKQAFGPYGKEVTVAIPAKTSDDPWNSWSNGYNYGAIGQVADKVMLMTYDENYGVEGPVASLPWVTNVVKYAVTQIPSQKILLGIANYGYRYPNFRSYGMKEIKSLISTQGGQVSWSDQYSEPYYKYWGGTIWFENEYSVSVKLNLVSQYNLGGIGIWRLGYEDQAFWNAVKSKLG